MNDYIITIFIILIISNKQKSNSIESFNDLFTKQSKIHELVETINKFHKFFGLNKTYFDNQFEEKKSDTELIDSKKQNKELENNIFKIQIIELGKFIQTNLHLIIFNTIMKFEGINPSEKISFSLQCYTKKNEKADSKANCDFLEFGKNSDIGVYKCRSEVNDKISYIIPYDDFIFDKNKNSIEDLYENLDLKEEIEIGREGGDL